MSLISIGFHGGSDDMDLLQTMVLDEIKSLHRTGPGDEVLLSIKESMMKTHKQNLIIPSYWLFWILDSYKAYKVVTYNNSNGINMEEFMREAVGRRVMGKITLLEEMSKENLREVFEASLNPDAAVIVDLRPKIKDNN
jgi:hypothetical protein